MKGNIKWSPKQWPLCMSNVGCIKEVHSGSYGMLMHHAFNFHYEPSLSCDREKQ